MKKKLTKAIACLCSVMLAVSSAGCKKDSPGGNGNIPAPQNTVNDYTEHKVEGTLHKGLENIPDTGVPFVVNGSTEYKLVYNAEDAEVSKAAQFIALQIYAATGANVATETNPSWSDSAKYIILDNDALRSASGVQMTTDDIGIMGYQLVTKGNSVFILAHGSEGYHLGALAFLRIVVGYECLAADEIFFLKDGSYLPEMNVVERPDFDFRYDQVYWKLSLEKYYPMGMIANSYGQIFVGTNSAHNSFYYLPPKEYEQDHPGWYTEARCNASGDTENYQKYAAQLCYTARGNEEEKKIMQQIVADKIVEAALKEENSNRNVINFTAQDESVQCTCDACNAIMDEYGSISAAIIMFTNGVDDIVQQKLQEYADEHNTQKKELYIRIYAYQNSKNPPNKLTEEVTCNEHVCIWIAASRARYSYTFYDDINAAEAQAIRDWGKFGKLHFWFYNLNSQTYFIPSNIFSSTVENFRFAKENSGIWMGNNGVWKSAKLTGFMSYKEFLDSRLEFNVNFDYADLKRVFFDHYFGDGGVYMEQFFDEMVAYETYLRDLSGSTDFSGMVITEYPADAKYWPKGLMDRWNDLCGQALKAIEKDRGGEKYEQYRQRIVLESLFPRYVLCKFYASQIGASELQAMRQAFYEDCMFFGINDESEYATLDSLWVAWQVDREG